MADFQSHLLIRLRTTLEEVDQGLRFRPDPVKQEFRVFLLHAIEELEGRRLDMAA